MESRGDAYTMIEEWKSKAKRCKIASSSKANQIVSMILNASRIEQQNQIKSKRYTRTKSDQI